jgi:hypothetical protein
MTTISYDESALREEMAELVAEFAPRRFSLCWIDDEEDDGGVVYWGLQLPSEVTVVTRESGDGLGVFSSAEAAQRLLARRHPLELIWLDPPLTP